MSGLTIRRNEPDWALEPLRRCSVISKTFGVGGRRIACTSPRLLKHGKKGLPSPKSTRTSRNSLSRLKSSYGVVKLLLLVNELMKASRHSSKPREEPAFSN